MNTVPYQTNSRFNCGPSAFFNLTGIEGSPELEAQLSKKGALKPFKLSLASSFLIWGELRNHPVTVFVESLSLTPKALHLIFEYEGIPKTEQARAARVARETLEAIKKRYRAQIRYVKDVFEALDGFVTDGKRVAVLISNHYLSPQRPRPPGNAPFLRNSPHWIVCVGKKGNRYLFFDSSAANGKTELSADDIKFGFALNRQNGFTPQLVIEASTLAA